MGNKLVQMRSLALIVVTQFKKKHTTIPSYENKTVRVTCWGLGGSNAIVEKLSNELNSGWEIVSTVEDHWRGGMLRHVYTVVLKRRKK